MFSSIINRNTRSLARVELSDEQIKAQAPSVFATAPVAGVSDKYTFLPTAQIVSRMRQEGWAPVEVQQQAVRVEGRMGFAKHLLRLQRRDQVARPGEYAVEIALVNSHDRSSAYQIHAGLWRCVCSNGLLTSDSTIERVSIRHSGREAEEIIAASFSMLAQLPRLTERVEAFRARQLTPSEQHQFAEQALKLRWDDPKLAPVGVEKILWPRRTEDTGADLWSVYNRVQENLLRGGQRDYHQRREDGRRIGRSRPITGLDESIRVNKQLWELAEALRAGKLAVN
jgi:hypothetical protein